MSVAWLLAPPALGVVLAWAAARRVRRRRGRVAAGLVGVLTWVAVTVGGVQAWAVASVDTSGTARALAWRDADVDDRLRFPSLPIPAGGDVLPLREGPCPTASSTG